MLSMCLRQYCDPFKGKMQYCINVLALFKETFEVTALLPTNWGVAELQEIYRLLKQQSGMKTHIQARKFGKRL